jgi:hypothetical protein
MTQTVNSPEDQKKISERSNQDNHLMLIDAQIESYRKRAAEKGDVNGYNEDLATMHSLIRYRQTSVETDKRINEPTPSVTIDSTPGFLVLTIVAFAIFFVGMVVGGIIN